MVIKSQKEIINDLLSGEVVGIPTDTVYGFAVLEEYKDKLYELKNRDINKKLISFIFSYKQIGEVDDFSKEELESISNKYWPGNNTLIFCKNNDLVSYRIPNNRNLIQLLKEIGRPILTTSANISGEPPCIEDKQFMEKFPLVSLLDGEYENILSQSPSNIYIMKKDRIEKIR